MVNPRSETVRFVSLLSAAALLIAPLWSQAAESLATAAVAYQSINDEQILDGIVEPVHQSTVAAEFVGRIEEINFDVDDFVPKDSVLIRFHNNEQRARLAQDKAAREEAKARLTEVRLEFKRVKNLVTKKLMAQSEMDRVTAALNSAEARLAAADAQVQVSQEHFDRTVIKAPYSGFVVARHVEVGETVSVGQALMTGMSLDDLRVVVQVPQGFIAAVKAHDRARVIFPGQDQLSVVVEHLTIFPYADPLSHTVKVRMSLPKELKAVRPGTFVKVAFISGESRRLLVPVRAVIHRSELTAVYVAEKDGRISLHQIRIGPMRGDGLIEVLAGLDEGESVVLDPVQAGLALKERQADHEQ
jgi:RND family efflux transporter MFP subunit